MTITIQEPLKKLTLLDIVPERWTFTLLSMSSCIGLLAISLIYASIYYIHKYWTCCWRQREDWRDSTGCRRKFKFFIQHVLPFILIVANCATDLLYLFLVPSSEEYIRFSLILTLFVPQLWYFRYSLLHSFDDDRHFGQFFCQFVKNYFAYATGQIDLLMKI